METKLKKLWPALAAAFVTLTSVVCAVDDMQVRNLENRVSALEQRRGAKGMINPPARPVVRDGIDLWIQSEALYMRATEDGLNYAINNENTTTLDGRAKNVHYHWNWGFRVGAGYNLPHDGWDLFTNWTWFQSHARKSSHHRPGGTNWQTETNGTNSNGDVTLPTRKAHGIARLHINLLDLELGREFFVSRWLTLRPFAGGRGVWVNRNYKFDYDVVNCDDIDGHKHNRFRGGGLRGGLNSQWGLGSGWSFFADLAIALIYGTHRLHSHQDIDPSDTRIEHIHNNWTIVRPMMDLGFGLRWDRLFSDDAYRIRLQLGWEQTTLMGFDKDMNFLGKSQGKYAFKNGDLSLTGLALQVRFDF